jgi:hypothetical protein
MNNSFLGARQHSFLLEALAKSLEIRECENSGLFPSHTIFMDVLSVGRARNSFKIGQRRKNPLVSLVRIIPRHGNASLKQTLVHMASPTHCPAPLAARARFHVLPQAGADLFPLRPRTIPAIGRKLYLPTSNSASLPVWQLRNSLIGKLVAFCAFLFMAPLAQRTRCLSVFQALAARPMARRPQANILKVDFLYKDTTRCAECEDCFEYFFWQIFAANNAAL